MATQKKPSASKSKAPASKKAAPAKSKPAPARKDDPIQEVIGTFMGFNQNTQLALGLALGFLIIQIIPDLRHLWWLNFPVAAGAGYLFWLQGEKATGLEQKVCRWGLLTVAALFILRDINVSRELVDYVNRYGEWDKLFSK